jgi:hypothetical protein
MRREKAEAQKRYNLRGDDLKGSHTEKFEVNHLESIDAK